MQTEGKELLTGAISLDDLKGVPDDMRAGVVSGQLAAYLAGAMLELGLTLAEIKSIGAFFSAAGTIAVGCHITFVDPAGNPWEPKGTLVDPDEVALITAIVANQVPKTQPFVFPVPAADLLPITVEDFDAFQVGDGGVQEPCVRQRLWFNVAGTRVLASNLGTKNLAVFSIAKT